MVILTANYLVESNFDRLRIFRFVSNNFEPHNASSFSENIRCLIVREAGDVDAVHRQNSVSCLEPPVGMRRTPGVHFVNHHATQHRLRTASDGETQTRISYKQQLHGWL